MYRRLPNILKSILHQKGLAFSPKPKHAPKIYFRVYRILRVKYGYTEFCITYYQIKHISFALINYNFNIKKEEALIVVIYVFVQHT